MSATVLGPGRWLGLVVRLAGGCVAAILAAALVGVVSFGSSPAFSGAAARRADTWAGVPFAAREAISRDVGRDQGRFAVAHDATHLVANGLGMTITFSRDGAVVRRGRGVSLELGLEAIGRDHSLVRNGPASPVGRSNTVSYDHSGIREWYANGPLGLEQGFIVARRVRGQGELNLLVARVPAGERATVSPTGANLTISYPRSTGSSLHYSDLSVTDAGGYRVPARIEVSRGRVFLRVSDGAAHYPLRVDPVIQSGGADLTESGANAFGQAVAMSSDGSTVVVGAPSNTAGDAAVYVFTEPSSTGWQDATQAAVLTASDDTSGNDFGSQVAISGDGGTIVVGAPGHISGAGAVYVFTKPSTGGWQDTSQSQELTASDGAASDELGWSVAVSGDGATVVAGSPGHEVNAHQDQGAAYVFVEPASGGWQSATQTAELTAGDGAAGDGMENVAISGDGEAILAGAPSHSQSGAAYVFTKPSAGGWVNATQTVELTPSDAVTDDEFGSAVALSGDGDTAVVAAIDPVTGPDPYAGAAYVFTKPPNGEWENATQTAELTGGPSMSGFISPSVAVSTNGDVVAVGAPYSVMQQIQLRPGYGVYVFSKPANAGWQSETPTAIFGAYESDPYVVLSTVAMSSNGGTVVYGSAGFPVVVVPPPPVVSTPPIIVGMPTQGETLQATIGAWSSYPTSYNHQWEDCDGSAQNCSPIAGAFGQSYTLTRDDVGSAIDVQETATNVSGSGAPANSPLTQVVQALSATSAPIINGDAVQGQTLSETHGSWNATVTGYAYQWERCDGSGANCSPIPGGTGQSYAVTNADAGHTIVVRETASNLGGVGIPARSAPTSVVIPLPPTSAAVPTISGAAVEGNTLTAALLVWSNTPTGVSYQWEDCDSNAQNCQAISGATGKTYTLVAGDIGHRVVVVEAASNAGGTSAPATSAATGAVPESGPVGLEIDNGDYATNDPNVTIEAAWPAGTQSILISNNGGFRTDTQTFAPAATIDWKLEQTGSDRLPKTVYVRFLGVGQDDINFTDDIILDETAPTVQSATVSGPGIAQAGAARAQKLKAYKLRLKAKDQLVGVCVVATNQRRSSSGETLTTLTSCKSRGILKLSRTLDLELAVAPRYVRVQNSAGDWSRWLVVKG